MTKSNPLFVAVLPAAKCSNCADPLSAKWALSTQTKTGLALQNRISWSSPGLVDIPILG